MYMPKKDMRALIFSACDSQAVTGPDGMWTISVAGHFVCDSFFICRNQECLGRLLREDFVAVQPTFNQLKGEGVAQPFDDPLLVLAYLLLRAANELGRLALRMDAGAVIEPAILPRADCLRAIDSGRCFHFAE